MCKCQDLICGLTISLIEKFMSRKDPKYMW